MTTRLRLAAPEDLDRVEALSAAYHRFEGLQTDPDRRRRALAALLGDPGLGRVFLILSDEAVAGFAALAFGFSIELGGRDAFIDELFLEPDHRGRGVGAAALALLAKEAEALGVLALHLEVDRGNDAARRLYRRLGFIGREKFHLMTRPLA